MTSAEARFGQESHFPASHRARFGAALFMIKPEKMKHAVHEQDMKLFLWRMPVFPRLP